MTHWAIGDVHGHRAQVVTLLQEAGLLDQNEHWRGESDQLWFMGDFCDRGPDGVGSIELVMRLQREASAAGGYVGALLGNHDLLIVSAKYFDQLATSDGSTFRDSWLRNGGNLSDLARLQQTHIDWLLALPAMMLVNETLLMHADASFYLNYGTSVTEVNQRIAQMLQTLDPQAWDQLLDAFSERLTFFAPGIGVQRARDFLTNFGAKHLIHGHTPIDKMSQQPSAMIRTPFSYADGLCLNVDAGLYRGAPGFVAQLD